MTKFQKIARLTLMPGEPRRFGVAADRVELRAEAGAAHDELGGEGAERDEEDEIGDALPGHDPERRRRRDQRRQERAHDRRLDLAGNAERPRTPQFERPATRI